MFHPVAILLAMATCEKAPRSWVQGCAPAGATTQGRETGDCSKNRSQADPHTKLSTREGREVLEEEEEKGEAATMAAAFRAPENKNETGCALLLTCRTERLLMHQKATCTKCLR